jgi:nucleoside-specific outer membrane channel protein Tsx
MTELSKQNSNYINDAFDYVECNMIKTKEIIDKLGKVDNRFLTSAPNYSKIKDDDYFICEIFRPAVLFEKIGNANKGVVFGPHKDYGDMKLQREKHRDDKNVYNMWVKGEIEGSVLMNPSHMGPENVLTGELFFGCFNPDQFRVG